MAAGGFRAALCGFWRLRRGPERYGGAWIGMAVEEGTSTHGQARHGEAVEVTYGKVRRGMLRRLGWGVFWLG